MSSISCLLKGGACGSEWMIWFITLTTMNNTQATMAKLMTTVRKFSPGQDGALFLGLRQRIRGDVGRERAEVIEKSKPPVAAPMIGDKTPPHRIDIASFLAVVNLRPYTDPAAKFLLEMRFGAQGRAVRG